MSPIHDTALTLDLDYIAICIAEQVVRVKISVAHLTTDSERAHESGVLLTRPLIALASTLGVKERVDRLVAEALPGAV